MMIFRSLYAPIDASRVITEKIFENTMSVLVQNQIPSLGLLNIIQGQQNNGSQSPTVNGAGRESFAMTKEIMAEIMSGNMLNDK